MDALSSFATVPDSLSPEAMTTMSSELGLVTNSSTYILGAYFTGSAEPSQECSSLHGLNSSQVCDYVQNNNSGCSIDEGFIPYTVFTYCTFGVRLAPLAVSLLFFWWLFLFVALAISADDFFCPSLVVIAKHLRMTDNIAGVTLLALGNGAPDVFSSLAAITNAHGDDMGLAFGALLGAGIFVTCVVAGSVACVQPFHAMERPMLRDVISYIGAVFFTFYVLHDGKITLQEAIGFVCLYVAYVILVIVSRIVYQRQKRGGQALTGVSSEDRASRGPSVTPSLTSTRGASIQDEYEPVYPDVLRPQPTLNVHSSLTDSLNTLEPSSLESTPLLQSQTSVTDSTSAEPIKLSTALSPILKEEWLESKWYKKIYLLFKAPAQFLLTLTTPVVNFAEDHNNWCRPLNSVQCVIAPVFGIFAAKYEVALMSIYGVFPIWAVVLIIGAALGLVVFCTSTNDKPPKYHEVFAYVGFAMAVIWIHAIANEIVNLLQTFGVVFSLTNAILGLTLLAWGNSIGDFVSDIVMAKQGKPRAGISACFAGPMFNLLLGIGIPFTIKCAKEGPVQLELSLIQVVLLATLFFTLVSTLILAPLLKFKLNRFYGIYLFVVYLIFLVVAILVEAHVIKGSI